MAPCSFSFFLRALGPALLGGPRRSRARASAAPLRSACAAAGRCGTSGATHRHAGAPYLVGELVELSDLHLGAEDLEPPLVSFHGTISCRSATCLGITATNLGVDLQIAPSHLDAQLLAPAHGASCSSFASLQLQEVGAEPPAVEYLPIERFLQPVGRQISLSDEDLPESSAWLFVI